MASRQQVIVSSRWEIKPKDIPFLIKTLFDRYPCLQRFLPFVSSFAAARKLSRMFPRRDKGKYDINK